MLYEKKCIYILIASLSVILIFSLAASCNMCGISLTEKTEEEEEEEPAVAGGSLRSFGINSLINGQIAEDRSVFIVPDSSGAPALYVGDTSSAMLVKGFLSFDISAIDGDNVLNAWLNLNSSRVGNPPSLMVFFLLTIQIIEILLKEMTGADHHLQFLAVH